MINKLHNEDCLLTMKNMEDNSVDCIVTDPPYGYSFMNKDWDKAVPSVEIWSECLRVLKPGAFAFIMSAPRQDVLSHMIINLDKAGFDTSFTSIYWTYASGFPKAMNIGKQVDKKLGVERKVVGVKEHPTSKDRTGNKSPYQNEEHLNGNTEITIPESEEAKKLNGSYGGFQPKPAVEIIIVVMKPVEEKSLTEQAMSNGKGITWLDDCRIPIDKNKENDNRVGTDYKINGTAESGHFKSLQSTNKNTLYSSEGRFPANLIVSDDALNDGKVYAGQQGEVSGEEESKFKRGNTHGDYSGVGNPMKPRNDAGSFSRYYDIDKWWEERINSLPENVQKVFPFLIVPKAAKSEKNFGVGSIAKNIDYTGRKGQNNSQKRLDGSERKENISNNHHPTVKPLKLLSYLITLGNREGDTIYDPFSGSGTTLIAARVIARNFIGSEIEKEYFDIAEQRLLPFTSQTFLDLSI